MTTPTRAQRTRSRWARYITSYFADKPPSPPEREELIVDCLSQTSSKYPELLAAIYDYWLPQDNEESLHVLKSVVDHGKGPADAEMVGRTLVQAVKFMGRQGRG